MGRKSAHASPMRLGTASIERFIFVAKIGATNFETRIKGIAA